MLIVTGTPRSGTSMWMQILVAAGFEAIGEPFPGDWPALLQAANPDGYWESQLLGGVYYRTNPHAITGNFLFPEQTELHDNFALLRDIATRRYAAHVCSYQSLLDDPERAIKEVFRWLGRGDAARAIAAIKPQQRTVREHAPTPEIEPEIAEVFDELYDLIHRGAPLSAAFLAKLNEVDAQLRPRLLAHESSARVAAAESMLADLHRGQLSQP